MSKVLFWVVVILVGLLAMRLAARHAAHRNQPRQRTKSRPKSAPRTGAPRKQAETIVQCDYCGVHVPANEAIHSLGKHWCSVEHARLGSS